MPKKGKGRGKGKPQDDSSKGKEPPKKEKQVAQSSEGAAKGKGKSTHQDKSSKYEEPSRREQVPSQSPEEAAEKAKEIGDSSSSRVLQRSDREQPKPVSPEGSLSIGRGRGRGRGKPAEAMQRPGDFFAQQDVSAAQKEEFPELSVSGEVSKTVKDVSCRPKATPVSEDVLEKLTGLSLEQEPRFKRNMAKRPDYGQLGKRIEIYVNYFKLDYKNQLIYHYDVDISESTKDNKMGRSLLSEGRTAKEDIKKKVKHVEREKRRNLGKMKCRLIIAEMIKSKELQMYCPVYDGQKNLFTSKPLPFKEEISFPVKVSIEGKDKLFYVTIKPVNKTKDKSKSAASTETNVISLQPLIELYSKRSCEIPEEVLLVYETIMNHREPPFKQVQFRNSFFSLTGEKRESLGCGLEIQFGYHQSVLLTQRGPVVVINLAAKAFHKAGSVINYANDVLRGDITRIPRLDKWQITDLSSALKGVQVKVTHQRFPRKYKIKAITDKSARELTFDEGNKKVTVADYFFKKYNKKLEYPNLPCIQMQTSNNTYIPMETCQIVEGQPKIGKLNAELTSRMIRSTAVAPEKRFKSIESDAKKVNEISKPFMQAFGLLMDVNLMKVGGRIIAAPVLAYAGHVDDKSRLARPDNRGVWRVEDGKKFYRVIVIKKWVVISFADERRCSRDMLSKFSQFLTASGNKCGMSMNRPEYIKCYDRNVRAKDAIQAAIKEEAQFAVVVLNRGDRYHSYDEVKFLADFKYGLVTQCMEDKTLSRINDQITTNVCLKINVKLGGINHIICNPNPKIFSQPVMVIGADTIHWTRGLGYPSIAAVVASVNATASRYVLACHTLRNKKEGKISQEIIKHEKMKEIGIELLNAFCQANNGKFLPKKIIVFRDGVSDGQFQHALEQEVSGLQEASNAVIKEIVPITYICVQKRHQTRFRPVDLRQGAGRQQNVPPGTVADSEITHPVRWDYFVCSHEGIQGTSKPAHYTVLHDDNKFRSDELQSLCYFLCHTYVRCTRSVSLPAPILYADLIAYRAKKYADLHIRADDVSSCSEDIERDFPPDVDNAIREMKNFENNMFYV